MVAIKVLKDKSKESIRTAIEHIMKYHLGKFISPGRMRAHLYSMSAIITEEEVRELMEDIYQESLDTPWKTYLKDKRNICYKCVAYQLTF